MPPGQLVLALSQEDPELSPSGQEINKNRWEPNQPWSQWAPTSPFSLRVSFNFLVCLSDHETPGTTPVCREIVPRNSHAVSSADTGGELTLKEGSHPLHPHFRGQGTSCPPDSGLP